MKKATLKDCLSIAWPLVLAMAGNAIMTFTDRLFLARYSATSIQAALPAGLMAFIIIAFLQNVVAYSGTFVAQYAGAGSRAACARAMGQGLWLSVLCVPILLLSIPFGNWLFTLAGHAPEVMAEEKIYYLTLSIGNIALPFVAAVSGFYTGQGFTRLVMVANLIGNATNVVLDPILIWGVGVIPEMGIVGAGVATALAQFLILVILVIGLCGERHLSTRHRIQVAFTWDVRTLYKITRFGLPSGGHVLLDVSTFAIFVFLTGRMDALSFSASNIAFSINHLIFAPLMGVGMAATILVGQRMGDRDPVGAARAGRNCLFLGWGYLLLCIVLIGVFQEPLLALFFPHDAPFAYADYIQLGEHLVAIFLAWAVFDTLNIVLGGALKGAGDTRFVMTLVASAALLLWMPSLLGLYLAGFGIVSLWLTMLGYVIIAGLCLLARFLLGKWKRIRLI